MNKKIFFIIVGALLLLALMFGLWFWLFGRHKDTTQGTGTFNTATDASGRNNGTGDNGNGQAPIGSNADTGANIPNDSYPDAPGGSVTFTYGTSSSTPKVNPPGVIWLDGSGGGFTNNRFIPTPINQLNSVDLSGIGNIGSKDNGSGGDLGLGGALAGAAISCLVYMIPAPPSPIGLFTVQASIPDENAKTVQDCLTRIVAKIALQQITASIVDWINSGFNGQPSFVQDYEQFFTDIADKSAGEFIEGSGLSFLCSPFKLQVKIAIAQSYASRKSSSASSCTLSSVVGNVDNFFKNSFSDNGGWPGFLEVTTNAGNNPYGAFINGQIALNNQVIKDVNIGGLNISPEGYLGVTEEYDCKVVTKDPVDGPVRECKTRITTAGHTVAAIADKTFAIPIDENLLADSFDEIISALMNQLITKVLYSGVSNLNGGDTGQQRGIDAAQTLLTNLQTSSRYAQQYGSAQQGSISDIQVAQAQLTTLGNCWATAASSTTLTPTQTAQAAANASVANDTIVNLESRVTLFNNNILKSNSAVVKLEEMQTSALTATTLKEVQALQKKFDEAQNSGTLITQSAVTSAQQDRQTLQSEMNGINQNTSAQLSQCYAFGH